MAMKSMHPYRHPTDKSSGPSERSGLGLMSMQDIRLLFVDKLQQATKCLGVAGRLNRPAQFRNPDNLDAIALGHILHVPFVRLDLTGDQHGFNAILAHAMSQEHYVERWAADVHPIDEPHHFERRLLRSCSKHTNLQPGQRLPTASLGQSRPVPTRVAPGE